MWGKTELVDLLLETPNDWICSTLLRNGLRIRPALTSPAIRHRSVALGVLANWSAEDRTSEVVEAIRRCFDDPYEDIRSEARALLDSWA
jgi:hypothetical protein